MYVPNRETMNELLYFSDFVNFKAVEKGFAKVLTLRFSEDGSYFHPRSCLYNLHSLFSMFVGSRWVYMDQYGSYLILII